MNIEISSLRCALQVSLLGAITNNIRAVDVVDEKGSIQIFFYYIEPFSDVEEDLSETVATEVWTYFEIPVEVVRKVVPNNTKLPLEGIRVFHRWEKKLDHELD